MNEENEGYSSSLSDASNNTTSSGSGQSGASVGDDGYYADNSLSLQMGNVDNSTQIGLTGDDLTSVIGGITQQANSTISGILGLASNNAKVMGEVATSMNGESSSGGAMGLNKNVLLIGGGAIGLFLLAKILKII